MCEVSMQTAAANRFEYAGGDLKGAPLSDDSDQIGIVAVRCEQ
ncbi:DUF4331 domain-containing protein [Raoultibacter phocaeensis]|nr:DUF4331 domain-containing protein [Raoultibacter phocaeensis]